MHIIPNTYPNEVSIISPNETTVIKNVVSTTLRNERKLNVIAYNATRVETEVPNLYPVRDFNEFFWRRKLTGFHWSGDLYQ